MFECEARALRKVSSDKRAVVAKALFARPGAPASELEERAANEVQLVQRLHHHLSVCSIFETFATGSARVLLLERCDGPLLELLAAEDRPESAFSELSAVFLLYQLFDALRYMHQNRILHLNIIVRITCTALHLFCYDDMLVLNRIFMNFIRCVRIARSGVSSRATVFAS